MHGAGKRRFSADSHMVSVVDYGVRNAVNLPLDYLVVPNNLLLSLIGAPPLILHKNIFIVRARDAARNSGRKRDSKEFLFLNCRVRWPSLYHWFKGNSMAA